MGGVYHTMASPNHLNLQLAGSNNLANGGSWEFIKEIETDGHQGDIVKWGQGYLVAFEEDKMNGKNNIGLKYYDSYEHLIGNEYSFRKSIGTSLHETGVEGTPDIRKVIGNSPLDGTIVIGFHYYDQDVDRLAMGVLQNGRDWKAWKDGLSEYNLRQMDYCGNIGSRKSFVHKGVYKEGHLLTLQGTQRTKGDWSSWKVMLGHGGYYSQVDISTPKRSKAFANPSITVLAGGEYVVTLFVPTEGNRPSEVGEALYVN